MRRAPRINVKIAALGVEGISRADAQALAASLRAELGRRLAAPGAVAALAGGPARRGRLDAGTFAPVARGGLAAAAAVGTRIAAKVYDGLCRGRSR